MKPQHLVPVFILALTLPGVAMAGSGATQKGGCGCSHVQKQVQKSSGCGCGAVQKGHGVLQKGSGIVQKSKGGCSTCCLNIIPAVLNGLDHVLSTVFSCDSCGGSGKSKSGLVSKGHGSSKSKGCGCGSSQKIGVPGVPGVPPNPFKDDELQAPALPSTEARLRTLRRPTYRRVVHTSVAAPVVRSEPGVLAISIAEPLKRVSAPQPIPEIRKVSTQRRTPAAPHNPLRAN